MSFRKGGRYQYVNSQYQISVRKGNVPNTHDSSRNTSRGEPRLALALALAGAASVFFSADAQSEEDSRSR